MGPESEFNAKWIRRQLFSDRNYATDLVPWEFAMSLLCETHFVHGDCDSSVRLP